MTTLSDRHIADAMNHGDPNERLIIDGLRKIGPCSVDVYLSNSFGRGQWRGYINSMELGPGEFILGSTQETVSIPDHLMAQVHGVSTVGRTGLFVQNAGLIDPGFTGQITLELFNATREPLYLRAGMRIAQLTFHALSSGVATSYRQVGRYADQRGATGPRDVTR